MHKAREKACSLRGAYFAKGKNSREVLKCAMERSQIVNTVQMRDEVCAWGTCCTDEGTLHTKHPWHSLNNQASYAMT